MRAATVPPVHEPTTPEAAAELARFDAITRELGRPLVVMPDLADMLLARWGRLPANMQVYVVETVYHEDMPTASELLPAALARIHIVAEPGEEARPMRPMRRAAAQWKHERNGSRR